MKIWAMFSVDNNYDQPPNNLIAWWPAKPTLEQVATAIGMKWPGETDEQILTVTKLWAGQALTVGSMTEYRIEELNEGVL